MSFMSEILVIRVTNHSDAPIWMGRPCQSPKMYYKIEIIRNFGTPEQYVEREYIKYTDAYFQKSPSIFQQKLSNHDGTHYQVYYVGEGENTCSISSKDGVYRATHFPDPHEDRIAHDKKLLEEFETFFNMAVSGEVRVQRKDVYHLFGHIVV